MRRVDMTRHASVRAQQRVVPPLIVDWLLDYGVRSKSHDAERIVFTKKSRRLIEQDYGKPVASHLSRYFGVSIVVDPHTDTVITVMWLH